MKQINIHLYINTFKCTFDSLMCLSVILFSGNQALICLHNIKLTCKQSRDLVSASAADMLLY